MRNYDKFLHFIIGILLTILFIKLGVYYKKVLFLVNMLAIAKEVYDYSEKGIADFCDYMTTILGSIFVLQFMR